MKSLCITLISLFTTSAYAGISTDGTGFMDPTIFNCSSLSPVQEGVATAGLTLTEEGIKIVYSNHVNDFNISFSPIKVMDSLSAPASVQIEGTAIVAQSLNGDFKISVLLADVVLNFGTVDAQFEFNGKTMTGRCSYSANNLRTALQ